MRILVGNNHLQRTGGTESYTYTLALELKRLCHEVEYFTFEKGEISDKLEQQGIPFMSWQYYDFILANHTTVVERLYHYVKHLDVKKNRKKELFSCMKKTTWY